MKNSIFAVLVLVLFASIFASALAIAESNDSNASNDKPVPTLYQWKDTRLGFANEKEQLRNETKDKIQEIKSEFKDKFEEFRAKIREHNGSIDVENRNITVRELTDQQKEIIAGKINAKTGLNLTSDDINGTLGQTLSAYMSNGIKADIKLMPDRASRIALERLRAKCGENNCSVELKEVGNGNKTRLAYEVTTEKDSKLFFFFGKKMPVAAQVDATTGQILSIKKPWWSFLAKESNANETEINDSVGTYANVTTSN